MLVIVAVIAGAHQEEGEQGQGRAGRQDGPSDAAEAGDCREREAAGHGPGQTIDIDVVSCTDFIVSQENFEKISRIIKKEFETFDVKKCKDFKDTITLYLENMLK